ncbi:MAG TPA: hypothetical protein PL060_06540, partial [bacterium]|nr:hypothetical protein [bacterium]
GLVIPIANYTLQPLNSINLQVQTRKAVKTVESAHCGHIPFKQEGNIVKFSIPLKETDFVKILY